MIFGKLFGGGESAGPTRQELPVVRNVTIGRQVRLDTLAWRRLDNPAFALDTDTLEITAQGMIRLDDGSHVHRFYTDDELMLQAVSGSADGHDADDFTVFKPWSSIYPATRADTDAFVARMHRTQWHEAGLPGFERYWYEGDSNDQPPVSLWEAVYHERGGEPVSRIEQTCMLYARPAAPDGLELLLALAMKPEGGDRTHEIMIGLPLAPAEFSA